MPPNRKRAHGHPCPYCERSMERGHPKLEPTRDHHLALSLGGTCADIVIVCRQCNMIKADMAPAQWAAFMERAPGWWKLSKGALRGARMGLDTPGCTRTALAIRTPGLKLRSARARPVIVPPGLIWNDRPPTALEGAIAEPLDPIDAPNHSPD